jgi:transcription elongation factor GreA
MNKPARIPFTQVGYDKVFKDIESLNKERAEVLIRLQTAREMGDLSENGAYHAAKWELGGIDRELRKLTYLSRVAYVQENKSGQNVTFGSSVTIENEGKQVTYQLVNAYESNPAERKISIDSPLGSKIMGKTVGDSVKLSVPAGEITYRIVSVK